MRGKAGTVSGRTREALHRRIELNRKIEDALIRGLETGDRNREKVYDRYISLLIALEESGLKIVAQRKTTTKEG